MPQTKKIISRAFKSEVNWYFYVPERVRERGGEKKRKRESERERVRARARKRKRKGKRERTKARAIIFLNRLGQSEKSASYTVHQREV